MSKLYQQYLQLKEQDNTKTYLFKCGIFYIFLGEDANDLATKLGLKLTKFTDEVWKCGFPINSLSKYQHRLEQLEVHYQLIGEPVEEIKKLSQKQEDYLVYLKNLDISETRPIDALVILKTFQEIFKNE